MFISVMMIFQLFSQAVLLKVNLRQSSSRMSTSTVQLPDQRQTSSPAVRYCFPVTMASSSLYNCWGLQFLVFWKSRKSAGNDWNWGFYFQDHHLTARERRRLRQSQESASHTGSCCSIDRCYLKKCQANISAANFSDFVTRLHSDVIKDDRDYSLIIRSLSDVPTNSKVLRPRPQTHRWKH